MDNVIICPWCEEKTVPKIAMVEKENGDVRERRCANCGQVLSAYLAEEGDFMSGIRKFQN